MVWRQPHRHADGGEPTRPSDAPGAPPLACRPPQVRGPRGRIGRRCDDPRPRPAGRRPPPPPAGLGGGPLPVLWLRPPRESGTLPGVRDQRPSNCGMISVDAPLRPPSAYVLRGVVAAVVRGGVRVVGAELLGRRFS